MKKATVILLVALFVLSSVMLMSCDVAIIEIKIMDAPETVTKGEEIDYSQIHITVSYEDNSQTVLALTDKGVTYTAINTLSKGDKTLSVSYGGKRDQVTVTVVTGIVDIFNVTFTRFENTAGYEDYERESAAKEANEKQTEFVYLDKAYQVGTANGYRIVPQITTVDADLDLVEVAEEQIAMDFTLSVDNGGSWTDLAETNNYVRKIEGNVIYFTSSAIGHTFKLSVSLSEDINHLPNMATDFEQEFEVVDGYNVYTALGLSVLDNLNTKSWASLKTHKYAWDDGKALADFSDVSQVILHNNITITGEFLPDNYFWLDENEGATYGGVSYRNADGAIAAEHPLKGYFKGSLKENPLGEEWEKDADGDYRTSIQRGLYVSDGIGLSGNYLTIDYEANYNKDGEKGLYIVYDYSKKGKNEYPESHLSVIRYEQAEEVATDYSATIQNVYFIGETSKTENIALPAGLMMMSSDITKTTVDNVIGTDWFSNFVVDASGYGTLNIDGCKLYNSFSSMVFSRRMVEINVTNSEMKVAGGPLFIIHTRTSSAEDGVTDTQLNIDSTANMESWLSGGEIWFEINNMEAEIITQLAGVASMSDTVAGTHYRRATSEHDFKINIIAVVIPDPSKVFSNQDAIQGTITVGENTYGMDDAVLNAFKYVKEIATQGATAAASTLGVLQYAYENDQLGGMSEKEYEGYVKQLTQLQGGFGKLPSLPIAPVYKSGNNYGFFDGTDFQTIAFLQQLYGGAQLAQGLLTDFNQTEYAALWDDVLGNEYLQAIAAVSPSNGTWTAGQLACWVNPGGLGQKPDPETSIKHFMILLGEDQVLPDQPQA